MNATSDDALAASRTSFHAIGHGKVVSARIQARWRNFATQGKPLGLDGEPEWLPYQEADRACLVIDRNDSVVNDVDLHIRSTWGSQVLSFR